VSVLNSLLKTNQQEIHHQFFSGKRGLRGLKQWVEILD